MHSFIRNNINHMNTITKASVSIFLDDQQEPCGLIYFNKNRERVIYIVEKADEEQIVSLFEGKNCTVKKSEIPVKDAQIGRSSSMDV